MQEENFHLETGNITFGVAPLLPAKTQLLSIKIKISGLKANWGMEKEENVERK